ncbi:uncharacterized protein ACHE_60021A [Aspergillus chevalieri]|uniref:Uncharacterized protein n=1 Tax=Aspergillus chevalieri TaxID=182096 RepID=A0A7R7VST4_ASPCH|nr:uncharacterized protein ACHE_60021A [Aspergillus chevalieri]BCR90135.1 hypothetical protein ACHE_60021A [Aspergillus chevalieri]
MLSVSLVLFFLFSSSAVLGADDYRTCYYPGGNKALGHMPCSDEEQTACCASDHICMANGLCIEAGSSQPYGFSRAACTDRNWGAGCPQVCISTSDNQNAGCAIIPFHANGDDSTYCCNAIVSNGSAAVCDNDRDPFKLASGTVIPGRAYLSNLTTKDSGNNNNRDVAIGAGVGVPLGVLFLTALGWALFERRKRYALLNSTAAAAPLPVQQPGAGGQTVMPQGMAAAAVAPVLAPAPATPLQELEAAKRARPQELEARW